MNRKLWIAIGAGIIMLMAVVGLGGCTSDGSFSGGTLEIKGNLNSQQEGIWVNGEGKVTAAPDIAILSVGVDAQAVTVADAQSQAAAAMDKVMAALKNGGVAAKDIQTQYFNIQKVSRYDNAKQVEIVTGYRVTNVVTAKIRDVTKAGTIIDAVTVAGGDLTRIDSIGFTIDNPAPFQEQARVKAVADAAAKAKQLSDAAGVKLGKIVYINENSYTPGPIYRDVASKAAGAPAPMETAISPGTMDVIANVQINYGIN